MGLTLVASSTLVSISTKRINSGSMTSLTLTERQSRPAKAVFCWFLPTGGLLSRSCKACCDREGWREARGEVGMPRKLSAKLWRWETLGLEPDEGISWGERGPGLDMV